MTAKHARATPANARETETNAAFEATFLEHWQSVQRTLMRLVGDPSEAEDLALEAFWRLHQNYSSIGSDFNLGGWLYRVATNLGLNALRSRKRRERHELQAGRWEIETSAQDVVDASRLEAEEERSSVRAVLGEMDPRQAQLLLGRHSGMSYAELAQALDLVPSSIGTLLARAEREFEKRYRLKGE